MSPKDHILAYQVERWANLVQPVRPESLILYITEEEFEVLAPTDPHMKRSTQTQGPLGIDLWRKWYADS